MSYNNRYHAHTNIRRLKRWWWDRRNCELIKKNCNKRIVVFLHMFYPDSWREICEYLKNLRAYNWDLIITYPHELENNINLDDIKAFKAETRFLSYPNKGYDIGPFIMSLKEVDLSNYDVVIKLQSKGVRRKMIYIYDQIFWGRNWFYDLFEGVLGARYVHKMIDLLCSENEFGYVCADNLIVHDPKYKANIVCDTLTQEGCKTEKDYYFIAGTCFAIRPEIVESLKRLDFSINDFEMVPKSRGMSLAHVLERYFTMDGVSGGKKIYGNRVSRFSRVYLKPIAMIMKKFSSERLVGEKYSIDDYYFYWKLDNIPVVYKEKSVRIGDLKYSSKESGKDIKLQESPAYKYLNGDSQIYDKYTKFHSENGLPMMSKERFDTLVFSMENNGYDERNIILVNERNIICDGHHRACYLASKFGLDFVVNVLQIRRISKKELIKLLIPRPMLEKYYNKKYGG